MSQWNKLREDKQGYNIKFVKQFFGIKTESFIRGQKVSGGWKLPTGQSASLLLHEYLVQLADKFSLLNNPTKQKKNWPKNKLRTVPFLVIYYRSFLKGITNYLL